MHGLVVSAFFSVMVLLATLVPGLPGQRVGQASAGEGDQPPPVERAQPPSPTPANGAASVVRTCDVLAAAAGENDLPVDFFARLIWQESRFDPTAVSRAGAQGVAQFMPATASAHGLAGRRGLPRETDAYVRIVTGQSPEQWARARPDPAETHVAPALPCPQIAGLAARTPAPVMKPLDPWGVQLVGSSSDATALAAYHQLQLKYASVLGAREPRVLHHGLARGSMGWARVHVGTESRAGAEKLCTELRTAGATCTVLRN